MTDLQWVTPASSNPGQSYYTVNCTIVGETNSTTILLTDGTGHTPCKAATGSVAAAHTGEVRPAPARLRTVLRGDH